MAGNWMDDRERRIRERDARGPSDYGDDYRTRYDEDRSFGGAGGYGPRAPRPDRVFGERESGASYGGPSVRAPRSGSAASGWQSPDFEGVSPAMRQGAYEGGYGEGKRFASQDYTKGGRYYGDDSGEAVYREEYGQGGYDYTDAPRGYDAQRSPTRERYHAQGYGQPGYGQPGYGRYPEEPSRPSFKPLSGGTGGYDYERGYGDGGRGESRGDRFEDAGRSAGDFLHRAGERVASWFNGGGEGRLYDRDERTANAGKRGLGPQGYKRSDDRISDDAHERLTDDTWLDASNIAISVSGGEVTLSGTVDSREAKHRAERLVEDLSGVTHVQNNLRIAKGSFLTSPAAGYGDSVLGAQMRAAEQDPTANGTGGSGSGQSTAGRKT